MSIAYIVVTVLGAAMIAFSADSVFLHAKWVVQPLADYGVPRLFAPIIGVIAAIAVVLYFVGAVITVHT